MNIETAKCLVDGMVFWPGWKFEISDHCHRFENTVALKVTYPAQDTGRENAATGYTCQEIDGGARATFPIMLDRVKCDEDLYAEVMKAVSAIRIHEDREALRVSGSLWAPFHPHATDGMERAETYKLGTVQADLTFGLV